MEERIQVFEGARTPLEVWKIALRRHAAVAFMAPNTTKDQLIDLETFTDRHMALLAENMHLFTRSELTQLVRKVLSQTKGPALYPEVVDAYLKSIREEPGFEAEGRLLAIHCAPKSLNYSKLQDLLLSLKRLEVVAKHGASVSPEAFSPSAGNLAKLLADTDLSLMHISDKLLLVKYGLKSLPQHEETSLETPQYRLLSSLLQDQTRMKSALLPDEILAVTRACLGMSRNKELQNQLRVALTQTDFSRLSLEQFAELYKCFTDEFAKG